MNENLNIYAAFDQISTEMAEQTAVYYLGTRFTYQKLKKLSEKFACALHNMGISRGDKIIIYIPNSIHWIVVWLGALRIGAICVPVTPIYTPHDLKYIANDCEADAIVCADTNYGYVLKVLPETSLKKVIITTLVDLLPWWKRYFGTLFNIIPKGKIALDENTFSFKKLLAKDSTTQLPEMEIDGQAVAEIIYTGGTTKFPKGVPITHELFLVSSREQIKISESLFPAEKNVILGNAPLFHILGQTCSLGILLVGGSLLVLPKVNLDAALQGISQFKVKTMIGVPTLYRMILEHERLDQYDLSSVEYWFCAGDVLPQEVGRRWLEKFGKTIYQGYGATETCGGVAMCPVGIDNPPKSVGQILPSKKVRIIDVVSLKPVEPGEPGELVVKSDPMVAAYLNKPQETEKSFLDLDGELWYRTGDILSMDSDENFYFVDRTNDIIKVKGYRVSASEIEAVLQEHPAVIESCVIGVADEKTGQRIKAYVVLKEDIKGITGYELLKWCRQTLVPYKIPQHIEFRDMLPKSKVGKLLRREIRSEEERRSETM
ncbi:MAG: acyl--CoA ligase [Deltaproteobacteria bacterium]|nr:acyl--CoA ligase [Deltaproteobacteria bacterium]MBT7150966.1 acyl--CoA ligase [Deltaproteobacteria bacterium]